MQHVESQAESNNGNILCSSLDSKAVVSYLIIVHIAPDAGLKMNDYGNCM